MPAPDTGDRAPRGTGSPAPALPPYPGGRPARPAPADRAAPPAPPPAAHPAMPAVAADGPAPAGPWPTVRPPSSRAVVIRRVAAVLGLVHGGVVYSIATDVLSRAEYLFPAVVAGGLLNLVGVALLWLFAARSPRRVAPERGPGMGLARDRAAARSVLRSGGTLDGEQRRLVAVDVVADAGLPLVAGAVFALLGPLVVTAVNASGPLSWLGPVTAGLVLLVLAATGRRTWSAHALHRAADRRHTVPRFEGSGAPWRPWP